MTTTWGSLDVQPKSRLHGAFSAISLRQIASSSAGIQFRQLRRLMFFEKLTVPRFTAATNAIAFLAPSNREIACFRPSPLDS